MLRYLNEGTIIQFHVPVSAQKVSGHKVSKSWQHVTEGIHQKGALIYEYKFFNSIGIRPYDTVNDKIRRIIIICIYIYLTRYFISYVVNFGNFMAINLLGRNFFGRIRAKPSLKHFNGGLQQQDYAYAYNSLMR